MQTPQHETSRPVDGPFDSPFDQVLLTRFNLPTPGVESLIRAQDGWLRGRVELFERYTVPSVRAQSVQDFRWVVYFDPQSPDWLQTKIDGWRSAGVLTPMFREEAPPEVLIADLAELTGRRHSHLLTTNLDNDDGIAVDLLQRLRSVELVDHRRAVFVPSGLIRSGPAVYLRTDPRNAFRSVLEPWPLARGCWAEWHNLVDQTMPVVELPGPPGWLQVVHGTNVSNRVRGTLTDPGPHRASFPGLLDDAPPPSLPALARERLLRGPARALRDRGRAMIKNTALRLLGKQRFDRAKFAAAHLLHRSAP